MFSETYDNVIWGVPLNEINNKPSVLPFCLVRNISDEYGDVKIYKGHDNVERKLSFPNVDWQTRIMYGDNCGLDGGKRARVVEFPCDDETPILSRYILANCKNDVIDTIKRMIGYRFDECTRQIEKLQQEIKDIEDNREFIEKQRE